MVEKNEDDEVPEPVAGRLPPLFMIESHLGSTDAVYTTVPVKDAGESVVPEVAAPAEEETPAAAEPEPEVENKPESIDTEPPITEPVEVDATPEAKEVEPVVSHDLFPPVHQRFNIHLQSLKVHPEKDESAPLEGLTSLLRGQTPLLMYRRARDRVSSCSSVG